MTGQQHAIVLSGGGANGAYEVGVLEALFSGRAHRGSLAPVSPSVFVGTSVGSYNAAAMVSMSTWGWLAAVRKLRELWLHRVANRDGLNGVFRVRFGGNDLPRDLADVAASWLPRALDLAFSADTPTRRLFRLFDGGDVISTTPLEALIADTIDPSRLTQAEVLLKIVACNWDTGAPVVFYNHDDPEPPMHASRTPSYERRRFSEENVKRVILASTAIPAIFPRIQIDGAFFVDGGVVMNTPLVPALDAGASVLHVIHLEPRLAPLPLGRAPSAFESLERILSATPAHLIDADIRYAALVNEFARLEARGRTNAADRGRDGTRWTPVEIHRYFPRTHIDGVIGLLDFERARLCDLVERGFRDAVEHDCANNGCVTPERSDSEQGRKPRKKAARGRRLRRQAREIAPAVAGPSTSS